MSILRNRELWVSRVADEILVGIGNGDFFFCDRICDFLILLLSRRRPMVLGLRVALFVGSPLSSKLFIDLHVSSFLVLVEIG